MWDLAYEWTDEVYWEWLAFTLYLSRPLTGSEEADLRRIILAWYDVGSWGGWGPTDSGKGVLHNMGEVLILGSPDPRVEWVTDMGSAHSGAVGGLMLCIQNWSAEGAPVARLVLGDREGFSAEM